MAATGTAAGVNPEAWKIIDGKLFLYWDQEGVDQFAATADTAIQKADENWNNLIKD